MGIWDLCQHLHGHRWYEWVILGLASLLALQLGPRPLLYLHQKLQEQAGELQAP
jgi:hypothetical protein